MFKFFDFCLEDLGFSLWCEKVDYLDWVLLFCDWFLYGMDDIYKFLWYLDELRVCEFFMGLDKLCGRVFLVFERVRRKLK